MALGGVGTQLRLGALGVVNHSWSHSLWQGEQGDQYGFCYRYNNRMFSLGTQHILRSARFGNLAIYDNGDNPLLRDTRWSLSRRSEQYNATVGWSGAVALIVPFGALSNASAGVERSPGGSL